MRSDQSKSFLELNFESIACLKRLSWSKIDDLAGGVIFIPPPRLKYLNHGARLT